MTGHMNQKSPSSFFGRGGELTKPKPVADRFPRDFLKIALGVILALGTSAICLHTSRAVNFVPLELAAVVCFGCLFVKKSRGVFFGFYATLAVIVLALVTLNYFGHLYIDPTRPRGGGI
jgi:hypothetical protein